MKGKKHSKLYEWQKRATQQALPCRKCKTIGQVTVDHIIPVFFIDGIGLKKESYDHDWNFQYLCRACNSLKRAQFDMTIPETFTNLRRYIALMEEVYTLH